MALLPRVIGSGNLHPRETLQANGVLGALNATLDLLVDGCSTISLDVRGAFVGTLEVVGTIDGVNFSGPIALRVPSAGHTYAVTQTAAGQWIGSCAGFKTLRVRMSAYTSGAATVVLQSHSDAIETVLPQAQTVSTVTGAAGAAVTLTLPAPGAGLRHYLTSINIVRFAAALLTAGAAPVVVTTTNMPNALAFSLPADAAAAGTAFMVDQDFGLPTQATAQNTATTIVAPVTANVIWRLSAGFLIAP